MKIIRAKDYDDMSRKAANIISAQIIMKPNCVLGLATGSTPIGDYEQLPVKTMITLFINWSVLICRFWDWDIMDILDLMSQDRHLRRGHIVWTFRRVLLRQIKDFLLRRRMFQDRHIPWG